jgi:hypothetical protein
VKRLLRLRGGFFQALVALALLLGASLSSSRPAHAWGPEAHRLCNEWAIGTLPPGMRGFFQANRGFILEHSNDPDTWEKKDRYEKMRHYIFLDKYGLFPYLDLPHAYKLADNKYGAGHLARTGVLPWQIGEYSWKLTEAMKAGKWEEAKLDAAALGFYVADAHDPLHTTRNYDGQLTDQTGLEARFGEGLVDRYSHFFIFRPDDAAKIDDPTEHAFQMALEANTWVSQILWADRQALDDLPGYTDDYYDHFYSRIGSTAMREISEAAHDVGSYWYTAWLNAGRPAMPK